MLRGNVLDDGCTALRDALSLAPRVQRIDGDLELAGKARNNVREGGDMNPLSARADAAGCEDRDSFHESRLPESIDLRRRMMACRYASTADFPISS